MISHSPASPMRWPALLTAIGMFALTMDMPATAKDAAKDAKATTSNKATASKPAKAHAKSHAKPHSRASHSKASRSKTSHSKAHSSHRDRKTSHKSAPARSHHGKTTSSKATSSKTAHPKATRSRPPHGHPARGATRSSAPIRIAPPAALDRKPHLPSTVAVTAATPRSDLQALNSVIELVRRRRISDASQAEATIGDPVARKLAEWLILRSSDNGATVERYRAFFTANPGWPSQTFFRRRAEAALWDDRRNDATVLSYFQNEAPLSTKGRLVLARVLLTRGDRAGAERLVREAWRDDDISAALESAILDRFGALLRPADHKARMDILLYEDNERAAAMRAAHRLGSAQVALAKARIAVSRRASNAKALLDQVPRGLHDDAGYIFSKIQWLRRQDKIAEAGRLMLRAPRDPARLHDLDEWWIERRVMARELLDIGDNRMAYLVARDAALPAREVYKTQQQFTAGWIALRFLNDPATATQHFAHIAGRSQNPTALARAGYWLGRAAEASGRMQDARAAYRSAAPYSTSYYGQLARARLGLPQIELHRAPSPHLRGVEQLEVVRAAQLLYALNEPSLALPMLIDMGENAGIDVLTGLGALASRNNDVRGMLLLGKAALNRGLPFDTYAFPVSGIPRYRPIGPEVEQSLVFAIARQESGFNQSVVSPAKAYGLMQVTPGAARYVTRKYGAHYDLHRLKSDPVYNTTLGAAELGGLLQDYRGSYVMTFAGYNAGRGNLRKWVARYGDPRDPNVDTVDWVERIPFSETRNYIQRVMENLQIYRARFGGGSRLQIEADLRRGAVQ